MTRTFKSNWVTLCMLLACFATLAACGGGNGRAEAGIDSLGALFSQAFNQGANDTPLDITNANLQVRLAGEPFEL